MVSNSHDDHKRHIESLVKMEKRDKGKFGDHNMVMTYSVVSLSVTNSRNWPKITPKPGLWMVLSIHILSL